MSQLLSFFLLVFCCSGGVAGLDIKQVYLEIITMPRKIANLSKDEWLQPIHHNFIIQGDPGCPDCGLWDGKTADESKMLVALAHCIEKMVEYPDPSLDLQWCLIGDDDTYFAMSNVLPLLRKYDPEMPHYLGFGCGVWVKNKYRLVCRLRSPSRGFLNGYASSDIAYGGKGMMISLGALKVLGAAGVAKCRRELVCGNMDGRVAHCLYNNGTGVQLTDISHFEASYGTLSLHRTNHKLSFQQELEHRLPAGEPFCFSRTKQPLHYKSGVMLLGTPSPWFRDMQKVIANFSLTNGMKLFHPLDIDLVNSKYALLPLEHLKPFHLALIDVYVDFPFNYASMNLTQIEGDLKRWHKYTKYDPTPLKGHPTYKTLNVNETLDRVRTLDQSGFQGKVGPILPWVLYMQIIRAQVVILPLENPVLRTVRTYYEEHVDEMLRMKFGLPFAPSINDALTNVTLLTYWRHLQGLSPANAQFGMYGGLTQAIADLSLPGRQTNPVYHPFWFETKIPHPPHKHRLELDMGMEVGVTFAELVPVDLAHYDECMVLLEAVLGWHDLATFEISPNVEEMYQPYLAKLAPEHMQLLKKMNHLDIALYRRAQSFLDVLRSSYQHPTEVLQRIVRERRAQSLTKGSTKKDGPTPSTFPNEDFSSPSLPIQLTLPRPIVLPSRTKPGVFAKPGFVFSEQCRAMYQLPKFQHTRTREFNGILVEGLQPALQPKPILRFGTKEDSWVQLPRTEEYRSTPGYREKIGYQRTSKYTCERPSPFTGTVIISDRFRFIYIAVYKGASRTLLNLLFRPEIEARYVSSFNLTDEQKSYFTFSFVRDPMTRFLSAYKTLIHRMQIEKPALVENMTHTESGYTVSFHKVHEEPQRLHTFVKETIGHPQGGVLVVGMQHIFTQSFFFTSTDAAGVPTLQREPGVLGLDFLGLVESLDHDWEALERILNLPLAPRPIEVRNKEDEQFRHPNESSSFHLEVNNSDLTPHEIRTICDFYRQDFICFGFPFPKECASGSGASLDSDPVSFAGPSSSGAASTSISALPTFGASSQSLPTQPLNPVSSHSPFPNDDDDGFSSWAPRLRRGTSPQLPHKQVPSDSVGIAWFGLLFLFLVAGSVVVFFRHKKMTRDDRHNSVDHG